MFIPFLLGVVVASSLALAGLMALPRRQPEVMIGAVPVYRTALVALIVVVALAAGYSLA